MTRLFTFILLFFSSFLFSQPTDGLIAHYPFDGDAQDISGNIFNGTLYGVTAGTNRFGEEGKAMFFNGLSSHIIVPDDEKLRLSGSYTISVWLNLEDLSLGSIHTILSKRIADGNTGYLYFITGEDHSLSIPEGTSVLVVSGGSDPLTVTEDILPEEEWVYVLFEFDETTQVAKTFFNLELAGEDPLINANPNVTTDLFIGIDEGHQNSEYAFYGLMDELRIYDRILTESEKEELFEEAPLSATAMVTQNVDCFGDQTGIIDVDATGGIQPLSYSIDGGITTQATNVFTNLEAGNYEVLITDSQGNTLNIDNLEITEATQIIIDLEVIGNTITINASGGNPGYLYNQLC